MHVVNVYLNKKLVTVAIGDSIFMAPLVYNLNSFFNGQFVKGFCLELENAFNFHLRKWRMGRTTAFRLGVTSTILYYTIYMFLWKLLEEKSTHFLVSKKTARVHLNEHI